MLTARSARVVAGESCAHVLQRGVNDHELTDLLKVAIGETRSTMQPHAAAETAGRVRRESMGVLTRSDRACVQTCRIAGQELGIHGSAGENTQPAQLTHGRERGIRLMRLVGPSVVLDSRSA